MKSAARPNARGERSLGIEDRDDDDGAEIVDDGERRSGRPSGRAARGCRAAPARRARRRCRSPPGSPSPERRGIAPVDRDIDQRRHGHAAQRATSPAERSATAATARPSTTSRLISSPTSRKKSAISPSLIHSSSDLLRSSGPSDRPKRIRSRLSTSAAKGEFASTRAAIAAAISGIAEAASLSMNSFSRLRSANAWSPPDSKTPGSCDPGVSLKSRCCYSRSWPRKLIRNWNRFTKSR